MAVTIRDIVRIPLRSPARDWAVRTATQKCLYSIHGFMWRNLPTIFQNTFQGDLTKSAFIEWLASHRISSIWEYDRHRTDGFRGWNRLGYQLRVTKSNGQEVKIDVNSSVPPHGEDDHAIVSTRDVKVTAGEKGDHLKAPRNLPADVYVQIYVRPSATITLPAAGRIKRLLNQEGENATRRLLAVSTAYSGNILRGFAWATRNDVDRFRRTNLRRGDPATWAFWPSRRVYWCCPIRRSRRLTDLPAYLR